MTVVFNSKSTKAASIWTDLTHYGVGILPARPRKPRDKAGVRLAQTYILGRLRHQTIFSLADCNTDIRVAVEDL